MTNEERDRDYDVFWDGTGELLPDRITHSEGVWERSEERRAWNRTGNHAQTPDYWEQMAKAREAQPKVQPVQAIPAVLDKDTITNSIKKGMQSNGRKEEGNSSNTNEY